MNLDVLTRPFDASEIKQRDGRKGKRFDYVETHSVIARLNEAFDGQWSFRVLDRVVTDEEIAVLGELNAGGETKQQWGSKERNRGSSLGDDLKAAASDAVKKCSTLFGVGLHLYSEDATGSRQSPSYAGETEGLTQAQRKLRERRRKVA